MAILISVCSLGYHGKTIDFEKYSPCYRTTVVHFLIKEKWDDARLEDILKSTVVQLIYKEAQRSEKLVLCIVDDTISSKTRPSSRALHPIKDAYFHQSHLKGKQDYGHQAVAVMLSCKGIVLNYATVMYDKTMPKVNCAGDCRRVACTTGDLLFPLRQLVYMLRHHGRFHQKGLHTIGALKMNRVLYLCGIKQKVSELALPLRKTDPKSAS